jgi:hypothetical protein
MTKKNGKTLDKPPPREYNIVRVHTGRELESTGDRRSELHVLVSRMAS